MLKLVNPQDSVAVGRLLEFFASNTPWYRSLWNIGLILGLDELHEACVATRNGILSEASVRRVCSTLTRKAGKDPALTPSEKAYLREQIKDVPKADGVAHHAVATVAELLRKDYLKRWAGAVAKQPDYAIETFARSIGAYLLDAGFSSTYLHALIKTRLSKESPEITLPELCEALQAEIDANPLRDFDVLLAFSKPPRVAGGIPRTWLDAQGVSRWLEANGFPTLGVRASTGITITVKARDPRGAADAARSRSDRFAARALIATGRQLERLPTMWVKGDGEPQPLHADSRGVRVKALYLENLVFETTEHRSVDAAIEMLAHLDGSSPTAAIAGGWGAIEGLLADPSDRATAADNLAALVTCSLPRAELTSLSYSAEKEHAAIAQAVKGWASNRERSRAVAKLIVEGKFPDLESTADRAATLRIKKVLGDPKPELSTIKTAIAEAFHRLYRQRNLILHGGKLDSVSLAASLRTVAKLAGAGMDRITHGQYVQSLRPLELVARAELSMSLIERKTALGCVDLLEPS